MDAAAASPGRDVRVIGLISAGHFCSHFYMVVLPPLFPLLKAEFGVSYAALGGAVAAFAIASGSAQTPTGFLVDRFGARHLLIGGLVLSAVAIALMSLAPSYPALLVLAFVAGLGNSVFHPADYSILSAGVKRSRLGRAFGFHTLSGNLGWAFAPAFMITAATLWDWRTALLLAGTLGAAVALVLLLQKSHLVDDTGAGSGGGAQTTGASRPAHRGFALLFSPPVLLLFLFFIFIAMVSLGVQSFAVTALAQLRGIALTSANAALSGFLVSGAFGVLLGGVIADRTRRYEAVAAVGFSAAAGMMLLIAAVPMPAAFVVAAFALAGLMLGIIWPSRDMMVRQITPPGESGKVFGFVSSGLDVGAATSPLLFGWIIDQGAPQWVFWMTAIFMLFSLVAGTVAARVGRRARPGIAAE